MQDNQSPLSYAGIAQIRFEGPRFGTLSQQFAPLVELSNIVFSL